MKRERKHVTIGKVSRIFIKASLLIMIAMIVSLFDPIGARAADQTLSGNITASELKSLGMTAYDTLYLDGDTTLTMDEPLTLQAIYAEENLTIIGNELLTATEGIESENGLNLKNCNINTHCAGVDQSSIFGMNGVYIENSTITADGDPAILAFYGNVTITNNSVVNLSGSNGFGAPNGTASISGVGTRVIINSTNYAILGHTGISLNDGLIITEPAGAEILQDQYGTYYIYESDRTTRAKKVTIKKPDPAAPTVNNTKGEQKEPSHTHSYSWVVTKYPTSTSDGEEAYQCSCGEIAQINIIPAISAFEEETINKIKSAPANGVVNIETKLFNSFGIGVRDALAAKPDVTLKVSFLSEGYKGERLKVTIPAGTDVKKLWDDKGWLGLCRAGSTLGYDNTQQ